MRCLKCGQDGLPTTTITCPNPKCGVMLASVLREVLPSGTVLDKYRIDYALGKGGFGITYRAMHVMLEQPVAIKEFYPAEYATRAPGTGHVEVAPDKRAAFARGMKRFLDEGRILARMRPHANVVNVQYAFEANDTAYLVMGLVTGRTLRMVLESYPDGRIPEAELVPIFEQITEALTLIHQLPIYHLDIKPENLLYTDEGRLVLIDFGAARQSFVGTDEGEMTLDYAPLELLWRQDVGPQSDIFELGMLLHQLLTGNLPLSAGARFLAAATPGGDTWRPEAVGENWQRVLDAALHLHREDRPPDIATLMKLWRGGPVIAALAPVVPIPPPSSDPVGPTPAPGGVSPPADARAGAFQGPPVAPPSSILIPGVGPSVPAPPGRRITAPTPPTLVVDRTRYKTINAAIRAAQPNARIMVAPGTYREGLLIDRPVEIVGDGAAGTIIIEQAGGNCLLMLADEATVRGLVLRQRAGAGHYFCADIPHGCLTFEDCDITSDSLAGLAIYNPGTSATVRRCTIHDGAAAGIYVGGGSTALLEDCTIAAQRGPGLAVRGARPTLRRCRIHEQHESCGILVMREGQPQIEECSIYENAGSGVVIEATGAPTIERCAINRNGEYAVVIASHAAGIVESCDLTRNALGPWSLAEPHQTRRGRNRE